MKTLAIDIETYSSVSLQKAGVYAYAASPDFEILLFGYGNEFVPYVVLTEKMLNKIQACTYSMDIFDQVAKMTTNYRVWEKVTDYLVQCFDIITDKVENAKAQG